MVVYREMQKYEKLDKIGEGESCCCLFAVVVAVWRQSYYVFNLPDPKHMQMVCSCQAEFTLGFKV